MVAQNMLPENPSTRDFVETTLQENPSIERFLERIQAHAREVFTRPTFQIRMLDFDEWDPPLILHITADIPQEEFIENFHALWAWSRRDPDFDESVLHVSLLLRSPLPGSDQ